MKTYGPFKVEDIASLPTENAKVMIKQGLAEKVEAN
jgi:DNA replication initiation complex subunit (GINS family)